MASALPATLHTVLLDRSRPRPVLLEPGAPLRREADRLRRAGGSAEAALLSGIDAALDNEAYDAVPHFRAWLAAKDAPSRLALVKDGDAGDYSVWLVTPVSPGLDTAGKGRFITDLIHNPLPVAFAAAAAVAWGLCLLDAGRAAEAVEYLTRVHRVRPHSLVHTARDAASLVASGQEVPDSMAFFVGRESTYYRDRFCEKPFTDFEISPNGDVHICCPAYLPSPVGNARHDRLDDILNSRRARRIRESILQGTFKYCDPARCKLIRSNVLPKRDAVVDPELRDVMATGRTTVTHARDVRLSFDPTCNLSCPSCRTELIVAKGNQLDFVMRATDKIALPLLRQARSVLMNGYGDVFASRSCRRILGTVNRRDFPNLRLDFITNGVLFTEREWNKFPNIHDMVGSVRVSIDAATEETYRSVRRGGDFGKLQRNLEFLAGLRRTGVLDQFMLSFVYQSENMEEMIPFVEWGHALGCDFVVLEPLMDWKTYPNAEFVERAVHLPDNPLNARFREIVTDPRFQHPMVSLGQ